MVFCLTYVDNDEIPDRRKEAMKEENGPTNDRCGRVFVCETCRIRVCATG
jgi:hypothetical protein